MTKNTSYVVGLVCGREAFKDDPCFPWEMECPYSQEDISYLREKLGGYETHEEYENFKRGWIDGYKEAETRNNKER